MATLSTNYQATTTPENLPSMTAEPTTTGDLQDIVMDYMSDSEFLATTLEKETREKKKMNKKQPNQPGWGTFCASFSSNINECLRIQTHLAHKSIPFIHHKTI